MCAANGEVFEQLKKGRSRGGVDAFDLGTIFDRKYFLGSSSVDSFLASPLIGRRSLGAALT
jgi:hypothetical protein